MSTTPTPTSSENLPFDAKEVFVSTAKEKILLTQEEQTSLASLNCRALDNKSPDPILGDPYAQPTLDRCDVDLTQSGFAEGRKSGNVVWVSHRALALDTWCEEFIASHNEPVTVLHLACGLDCRYLRVRERLRRREVEAEVRWIDVEMPRVAELRQRIFSQPPGDYMLRALDVTREGWIRDLPADRPAMVIAEGVFCYLEPENVTRVFRDVADYFPSGQIAFDKMGTLSISLMSWVQFLKGSKSAFQWGIDEPKTIERFHPRLKVKDCVNKKDFMDGCIPIFGRMNSVVSLHPGDKYNGQFLRVGF